MGQSYRFACQKCGRVDHTLRMTVFTWVFSLVLFSSRRVTSGVWCGECRRGVAMSHIVRSALLGWWGIPWGIFWTIGAIANAVKGGDQPAEINAMMLRTVASRLIDNGNFEEAKRTLLASNGLDYDPDIDRVMFFVDAQAAAAAEAGISSDFVRTRGVARDQDLTSMLNPGDLVSLGSARLHPSPDSKQSEPVAAGSTGVVSSVRSGWVEVMVPGFGLRWAPAGEIGAVN